MPLGTGNDLSLSFGWGNLFLRKWIWADKVGRTDSILTYVITPML